jgi:lactoylglutathione lyase
MPLRQQCGLLACADVLSLTHVYCAQIDHGTAYAQIALGTPDVYKAADSIRAAGYAVTREPGPLPGIGTKITACKDPDGFKVCCCS